MRVAVIGGGISGLTVAYHLKKSWVDVTLFEASDAVGGNIRTERRDGLILENGPNSLLANRYIADLVNGLGLRDQVVAPNASARHRYIVRGGRMVRLPSRVLGLFFNGAFSAKEKARLLFEPFIRGGSDAAETVYDFFARRFGSEIADYALDPFVSGIYAGDPRRLSVKQAFPRLYELEQGFGSLTLGAILGKKDRSLSPPRGFPRSFTFKDGVATLVSALEAELGEAIRLNSPVFDIKRECERYVLLLETGRPTFDAVVVSTPSFAASDLVREMDQLLAAALDSVTYPPISVVYTTFTSEQVKAAPEGFGVLIPAKEKRQILGSLFNSSVFEGRAPAGYHLFTTFIGGSRNAELGDRPEDELAGTAAEELKRLLNIQGAPSFSSVKKWKRSIPQYNVGYDGVLNAIEAFRGQNPGIYFCSNFYKGISVGDCVRNGALTAGEIVEFQGGLIK
jgi:protoporphyrinogen/coproporphyrinogen III oxidase